MKELTEKQSEKIFWVIQTVFGVVIGQSFSRYGEVFLPTFQGDAITVTMALISVYACVLWSWIDFSYSMLKSPYNFTESLIEKFRFVSDLLIVLIYTHMLLYLSYIKEHPTTVISGYFFAFAAVFAGYAISGVLRMLSYGRRASKLGLILTFMAINAILATCYGYLASTGDNTNLNRWFILATLVATIVYRLLRVKRQKTVAVDVDGVLANQISSLLPKIKQSYDIELKYEDVTDWRLPIGQSSIDKIIVSEQKSRSYVVDMPLHPGAKSAIDEIAKKHYLAIATARPPESDDWTKEWLRKAKIHYDSYFNLKEGGKQNASQRFDVLIDDYIGNIVAFLDDRDDHKAILFDQPWNQERAAVKQYIDSGRLRVVNRWEEIPRVVAELL